MVVCIFEWFRKAKTSLGFGMNDRLRTEGRRHVTLEPGWSVPDRMGVQVLLNLADNMAHAS
jgi:hypothetical protein